MRICKQELENHDQALLWCILFILCWPVALLAIVLYPIVWLILLPFRLAGIAVHGSTGVGGGPDFVARTVVARRLGQSIRSGDVLVVDPGFISRAQTPKWTCP